MDSGCCSNGYWIHSQENRGVLIYGPFPRFISVLAKNEVDKMVPFGMLSQSLSSNQAVTERRGKHLKLFGCCTLVQ